MNSLGLNEIHYFSVRALSVYIMYLELKTSQKVTTMQKISKWFPIKQKKFDYEILVDSSCAEEATQILDKLGCMYNQLPLKSYKGEFFFENFLELEKIVKNKKEHLLVSDDKFLLGLFGVKSRVIFSSETKFKKGKYFSL